MDDKLKEIADLDNTINFFKRFQKSAPNKTIRRYTGTALAALEEKRNTISMKRGEK